MYDPLRKKHLSKIEIIKNEKNVQIHATSHENNRFAWTNEREKETARNKSIQVQVHFIYKILFKTRYSQVTQAWVKIKFATAVSLNKMNRQSSIFIVINKEIEMWTCFTQYDEKLGSIIAYQFLLRFSARVRVEIGDLILKKRFWRDRFLLKIQTRGGTALDPSRAIQSG